MENNDNIIMSRIAFERMQTKDEKNDRWRNVKSYTTECLYSHNSQIKQIAIVGFITIL